MLSERLKTIANEIKKEKIICDIGTDHGLLPIYILNNNSNISKIYAVDSKKDPLEQAKNNIKKYNIPSDKVNLVLANGFDWLENNNIIIDNAIIAGLGGTTIVNILQKDSKKIKKYIICPNNNEITIRQFIKNKKFFVEKEILVKDKNFYYHIIIINKENGWKIKNKKDLLFGPFLRRNSNENYLNYWKYELEKINKFFDKLKKNDNNYKNWKKRIKLIKKELERKNNE